MTMAVSQVLSPIPAGQIYKSNHANKVDLNSANSRPIPKARTVTELIQYRAEKFPNKPSFGYPSQDGEYQEYTFSQLRDFSYRAACNYATKLPLRSSSQDPEVVVALLGLSNLDYFMTALALSRLGFTVLYLSTRISETAIISLLETTKCQHILLHDKFKQRVESVAKSVINLETSPILDQQYYLREQTSKDIPTLPILNPNVESGKICWIIHSSGSTGLPKPIFQTHSASLRNYENSMRMDGFITLPLYHAHGISSVFRSFTALKKIYLYSSDLPLTSQNLLNIMRKTSFDIFYGVPYALKLLSETSEGIERLSDLKVVMFGGSACPDALGDLLVNGGVNLVSHYGTTETGQLMDSARPSGDKAWNYVRAGEKLQPYVRWEAQGANLFELVVLDGWGSKVATNRPDGSYATKDVFEPHPSVPHAWKYAGRLDDTIVLMNGEKAVPVAMEQGLRQHPLLREAVMFGSGKAQLGMVVIASELASNLGSAEVIEGIWPNVSKENSVLPAYAQLSKDMCRVLPAGTSFPQTDKGTLIRQAFYREFASTIEKVYLDLESKISGALLLSEPDMRAFIRIHMNEIMPDLSTDEEVTEQTDFFSLGMDSLQSMRFRGIILQNIQLNGRTLPQNVVFDNPSIVQLARYLCRLRDDTETETEDITQLMESLILKYSTFSDGQVQPRSERKLQPTSSPVVLVTGATGSLGANIVAQLALDPCITGIVCLVRAPSDSTAQARILGSLNSRGLTPLPAKSLAKIFSYASDFSKPGLGLEPEVYDNISDKITTVIHSAWSVNFNHNLSSFEKSCIAGTYHLLNLCLSSPNTPTFNFCSSVSAVANTPSSDIVPESLPPSLSHVQNMGYAQSKLVTEHIVSNFNTQTPLSARILRIGQVIASTQTGIWNSTEAIPLMLQTATVPSIHALPALNESSRWLPVDTVARTVIDIARSETTHTVFNVVNPRAFHWTADLLPALRGAGLAFDEVPQREWIRRLKESDADPVRNPAVKLVEFFAGKYDNDVVERRGLEYETAEAVGLSEALREVKVLDWGLVKKFVEYFVTKAWVVDGGEK